MSARRGTRVVLLVPAAEPEWIDRLNRYAAARGYEVVEVIRVSHLATGLRDLLTLVNTGEVHLILVAVSEHFPGLVVASEQPRSAPIDRPGPRRPAVIPR